ncbi:hypothetical protein [Kordiimonas sp.]|uniref:hypothetical protein n=1 Tax=Kordiimonas sp. TaxID=1970157 RepID=UPI003A94CAC0
MYHVELHGSDTATCPELELTVTARKHGVIDELARKMIAAGANPEEDVVVYRGTTRCFFPRPLRAWAATRLVENDERGFIAREFVEAPEWMSAA